MEVYVALNSTPDYTSPAPSFHSVHTTLSGAISALYPKKDVTFSFVGKGVWDGPDGFGMVKRVVVQDREGLSEALDKEINETYAEIAQKTSYLGTLRRRRRA